MNGTASEHEKAITRMIFVSSRSVWIFVIASASFGFYKQYQRIQNFNSTHNWLTVYRHNKYLWDGLFRQSTALVLITKVAITMRKYTFNKILKTNTKTKRPQLREGHAKNHTHENLNVNQQAWKNLSCKCAYGCGQLQYTLQHRTVVIIFTFILQTVITADMSSPERKGKSYANDLALVW